MWIEGGAGEGHALLTVFLFLTVFEGIGGPEGPGDEGGLEEEAGEALVVGVKAEGAAVVGVLRDVAGKDGGEEAGGDAADGGLVLGEREEGGAEGDFGDAGLENDGVGIDRNPRRDLCFEGFAGEGEVGGSGEDEHEAKGDSGSVLRGGGGLLNLGHEELLCGSMRKEGTPCG